VSSTACARSPRSSKKFASPVHHCDAYRRQSVRKPSHIPQPILQPIPFGSVLTDFGRRRKTAVA
jgi:hypothetical protein